MLPKPANSGNTRPKTRRKTPPNKTPESSQPKTEVKLHNRSTKPRPSPTPLELEESLQERRDYDKQRNQRPERKIYARDIQAKRYQSAKELGICRTCSRPAIPDQP